MWLRRPVIAIALLLLGSFQAFSQDAAPPSRFPKGDEVLRFESIADVPESVLNAIRKANCMVDDNLLRNTPVLEFRPSPQAGGYAVLASCGSVVGFSVMFWMRTPRVDPEPMWFAMPHSHGEPGFFVTTRPGFLEWDAETKVLTALQSNDICPRILNRKTYRFDRNSGEWSSGPSWLLTKIEVNVQPACGDNGEWKPYWEATPLPDLPKLSR